MDAERGGGGEGARFSLSTNNPNPNSNSYITSTTTPFNGLGVGSNQLPTSISSPAPGIIQTVGGGGMMNFQNFKNGSSDSGMVSPPSISFNSVFRDNGEQQIKRKRGRPRRFTLDGNGSGDRGNHQHKQNSNHVGLGLSPFSSASPPPPSYSSNAPSSSDSASKRNRGRPPGTGKKQQQQLDSLGSTGVAFTPHVIAVKAGEDIASKIMSFSQEGPHAVCILSANGAISNVTLRQPAMYGGTVTYEGRFEIISLSGSFLLKETGSTRSRSGGMSVSLAGSDGRVLGGGVAGILMAATPVQVVLGKFIVEEKPKAESFQREPSSALPPHMACFRTSVVNAISPSQGASSESSDEEEEEEGSPLNQVPAAFNSTNQPIQNMSGYPSINWGPSHLSYPSRHDPNMNNLHN